MPYSRRCDRILLGRNKGGETKLRGCTFVIDDGFVSKHTETQEIRRQLDMSPTGDQNQK
jgi:hypothetical protein